KLSYHYAHHDKKQLAVAALFAMFVEMLRVEEIEFRTRSGLQQEELDVRLIVDKPEGGDGIYGKTVSGLSASRWTGVTAVVADLVSRSVDSLWDAYVELIDEDVDRLSDVEALFSSDDNETEVWDKEMDVWDTVEEMSDIVWEHSWEFATSQPSTFHSLWDGIVSGILYPEQDMKGVTPTRF
ncbi:MAG: hypothetical protein QF898_14350, partial [SAR202 cluster bacterium]|nr:hypothetical protein [SAR202 cluster bacterium]